nr:hypothetical protein [uncultured Rhodoferax sp.]
MLASEKLAIAAHLHVLLRRKTGRVTDTQWMADNVEYAMEIVRFARQSASDDGHTELVAWADKLELAVLPPTAPPRTKDNRSQGHSPMPTLRSLLATNAAQAVVAELQADSPQYVRGLR